MKWLIIVVLALALLYFAYSYIRRRYSLDIFAGSLGAIGGKYLSR